MLKILLLEDSKDFKFMVNEVLKSRYEVSCAETIAEARTLMAEKEFALFILDISLPDGDGLQFCAELQRTPELQNTPVVILTGKKLVQDRVLGWATGADDYIEKPFDPFEFQARIDSRIRKYQMKSEQDECFTKGNFQLNLSSHEARITTAEGSQEIALTRNEFKLLHHLLKNHDRVLSRSQIQLAVWGPTTHITDRTVDKHVSSLRQKLAVSASCIQTVSGLGYRFSAQKAS